MSGIASSLIDKVVGAIGKAYEAPLITSAERVLTEDGSLAVKALVSLTKQGYMVGEQHKGQVMNAIKDDVVKIAEKGPAEAKAFNDFHEHGVVPADVHTGLTAVKMKNMALNLRNEAQAVGIKTQPLVVPNYFPHMVKEGMFDNAAKRQEMIDHLVATRQARNVAHASQLLGVQQGVEPPLRRVFHPFESPRKYQLDPAMLRDDLGVMPDYLMGAAERIGRAKVFGPEGEKLEELLSIIRNTDGEAKYQMARSVVADKLGYSFVARADEQSWERGIKAFTAVTKLHLAPIANSLGGAGNMIATMGLKNFAEGFGKMAMSPSEAYEFADGAGASLYRAIQEMKRITGAENQSLMGKLSGKVFLNPAENMARNERMMRVLGSSVGKTAAESEFAKLLRNPADTMARRRLAVLGIDVNSALQRGALDASDKAKAAFVFANKTMLQADAFALPTIWRDNPWGRIATMYKPFVFMQTKFVRDEIIKPAIKRQDFRPLIWAAVTFPILGEIAGDLKMLARGRSPSEDRPDFDKYPMDRIVDNMAQIGGLGVALDVTNAVATGSPTQTLSFLSSPFVTDVADTAMLIRPTWTRAQEEARSRDRLSYFLKRVPVVGPLASAAAVPRKARVPGPLQKGLVTKTLGGK